jgi:hypothetical protein
MASHHDSYWCDVSGASTRGDAVELRFKLYCYHDGELFWEVRHVFHAMLGHLKFMKTCKVLKKLSVSWEMFCDLCTLSFDHHLQPSTAMVRAKGPVDVDRPMDKVRGEITISTHLLIIAFVVWATESRQLSFREKARAALLSLLSKTVAPSSTVATTTHTYLEDAKDECTDLAGNSDAGFCHHLETVRGELVAGIRPQERIMRLLCSLGGSIFLCRACRSAFRCILLATSIQINDAMPQLGLSQNPLKQHAIVGPHGRKRRMDEDYKQKLTSEIVKRRKGAHGTAVAGLDGVDPKRLRVWCHKQMAALQVAAHEAFGEAVGVFGEAHDGARFGNPAEECLSFQVVHMPTNQAMWLPNQVCGVESTLTWICITLNYCIAFFLSLINCNAIFFCLK